MNRSMLGCAAFASALTLSFSAQAQTASSYGFPVGEKSRIHTNLDLAVAYDSNPDRTPGALSDWKAVLRPGLAVDVPGSSLGFNLLSQLSVSQYFGASTKSTAETDFGGLIAAKLHAGGPDSHVTFRLEDDVVRTPTFVEDAGALGAEERRFALWANHGQAVLGLRPGGGALEFELGYQNGIGAYDDLQDSRGVATAVLPTWQRHGALFNAKLRFLPKTAILFHSDFSFFSSDAATNNHSTPYNVTLGLIGQVTPRISTNISLGIGDTLTWSKGFFSDVDASNARTLIATVEGTYDISDTSRFSLGYRRLTQPVILLQNYRSDAFYLKGQAEIGGRLIGNLLAQYDLRSYDGGSHPAQILTVDARLEYWFFEYLSGGITYRLLKQMSDGPTDLLSAYERHEVLAGAGLRY